MTNYQKYAQWFLWKSSKPLSVKRLTYLLYFLNGWSQILEPDLNLELEFKATTSNISEKHIVKDYLAKYGHKPIPKSDKPDTIDAEWLLASVYMTYHKLSDNEMLELIQAEDAYKNAKNRTRYGHVILDADLKKYYQFLHNTNKL